MKDKISIVVPIYNTAEYLPRCIESLLKQTYKSLEIILVDDGSNDKSCEIINEYSYKDSRIINIHNENRRGVSEARNTGIKIAKGKYISFVDSDDFIERDMYEVLIKNIQDYDADISICSYFVVQDNETIKTKNYYGIVEQFSTVSALRELIKREKYIDSVWGKLYRKDLIQGVSFELNKLGEDVIFNYQIFPRSKKVVFVDTPKYYYLKRPKSITGSLYLCFRRLKTQKF
jgi:glycosyltransferase involved in cell wall biosynthesis